MGLQLNDKAKDTKVKAKFVALRPRPDSEINRYICLAGLFLAYSFCEC